MKEQVIPTLWLIGLSVVLGVAGQTALKLGVDNPNAAGLMESGPLGVVTLVLRSPLVVLGLLFYGVSALVWIVVLSRVDLSYAYPFLALNFILITIVSRVVLSETIPIMRWLGVGVICVGILLIARSASTA